MSVTPFIRPSETGDETGRSSGGSGRFNEARSWITGDKFQDFARSPSAAIGLPGGKRAHLSTDRVRAKPALTPTLSGALSNNAIGLGIWGTLFPNSVKSFLGIQAPTTAVRVLFGARELVSGVTLASDPTKTEALWGRVAGDIFDIAVLSTLNRSSNPKQRNVKLALGVVLAVTALDALAAVRMSTVRRSCED